MKKIFKISRNPTYKYNAIFNSPHSGDYYSKKFLESSNLDIQELRTSEDYFVGKLYNKAKFFNCILMEAIFPRSFVDLNRSHLELDPKIILGHFRFEKTPRNMAGLGVIPRLSGNGKAINTKPILISEAKERLERYYLPYHKYLQDLISYSRKKFGYAVLFDCHSMPSKFFSINSNIKKINDFDIILGDINGTSCDPILTENVRIIFEKFNFSVRINQPFAGGFITKNYGDPINNIHALQIEINKKLYMDENKIIPNRNYNKFKKTLTLIIKELSSLSFLNEKTNIAAE